MSLLSFDEALKQLIILSKGEEFHQQTSLMLPLFDAVGRVLAQDVKAQIDVPNADNSAMDGYAFRYADWEGESTVFPISQRIAAGDTPQALTPKTAARIFTGAPIPPGADTVVMQELTEVTESGVRLTKAVSVGNAVRLVGSDIKCGASILSAGQRLRTQDVALAASTGVASLMVRPQVRVGGFFTGNEVRMPGETLGIGQVYNSNRFLLQGLMTRLPVEYTDLGIVKDDFDLTRQALREAAQTNDLVITTGGVSVGEEDHVKAALEAEGELNLWKIAIKPGKPLAYGRIRRSDGSYAAFIGLPGNPVSSFITFLLLVRPYILSLAGVTQTEPSYYSVRADFDWLKPDTRCEFIRVKYNAQGGLDLFPVQQSGVLSSTVWADGLVKVLPGTTIHAGQMVSYLPFSEVL